MKKYALYTMLVAAVVFAFSSCSSFLAEHPKDKLFEDQAYERSEERRVGKECVSTF